MKKKILLSAYACEPNKGSEPGVGWSWATELAKTHEVWVLTRDNNEKTINEYLKLHPEYSSETLHFIYVGLSKKLTFWKKGRRGIRLFYMLWQHKALSVAKKYNSKIKFDLVQHITFVSYTQPSYMYKLGIPFIWGPISGGENIPKGINLSMSLRNKLVEIVRKFSQCIALCFPSIRKTMKYSKFILVATDETRSKIPDKYHSKTFLMSAIGIERLAAKSSTERKDNKLKIIMAGRLIYWKAFDIGIKAFMQIAAKYPYAELHILGEGNLKDKLMKLAGDLLDKQIFFEKPVLHDQIYSFYSDFDIFLNTTLRDSGCMTMMEAMSVGIPCIAIATGGPETLLQAFEWAKIQAGSYQDTVSNVTDKLTYLIENRDFSNLLGRQQREYLMTHLLMSAKCKAIEEFYKK